ncbi:hypothetical protein KBZ21_41615, partial [Streptomyces sp. A73]|nr:hypothetical protein [Streptomyces sp. A73]
MDGGLAVWLRADGYDTYLVEDLDGAFQVFKHVAHVARATAECARLIAADVLMGMPYSAEELADENDDTAPAPKTRK